MLLNVFFFNSSTINDILFIEKGSGKSILNQLKDYLINMQTPEDKNKIELECTFLQQNLTNIEEALFKPETFELDSNPISTSYKPLVSNLKALSYLTYDPFREADELSAQFGTEIDICTLACLSFSYLTMGQITAAKKCFFENSSQFLHELKSFYHEFECVFDDIEHNEQSKQEKNKLNYNIKDRFRIVIFNTRFQIDSI